MHAVVVIPGIMGTELLLPGPGGVETVWPPTALETKFGYGRVDRLASPQATAGKIISNVLCVEFYRPLFKQLEKLGFTPGGADQRLVAFPYDWRRDLFDLADMLATAIGAAHAAGASKISLVAHSMGGLISRLVLEDPRFRAQPWFAAIDQLIAIATPHLGAPLALGRVLGRDSAFGISGRDFARLSNLDAFPSAYQLLPAPGEGSCWDQSDPGLAPLDIYDPAVAATLGLKVNLLARAKALHTILGRGNKPEAVRYFYFAGTGHRTATRVNVFRKAGTIDLDETVLTRTDDGGDGTVPLYSALPRLGQRHLAVNEHPSAFTGGPFHQAFVRLLGGNDGDALELPRARRVLLSVEAPIIAADQTIEVLLYAEPATDDGFEGMGTLNGTLLLTRIRDADTMVTEPPRRIPVSYSGPIISRLRLHLDPVEKPGHYALSFEGRPAGGPPAHFSACASLPPRTTADSIAADASQTGAH